MSGERRYPLGPWFFTYEKSSHPRVWGNASDSEADPVAQSQGRGNAELIVTLHRTIPAQLDMLRDAADRMAVEQNQAGIELHYRHPLAIARAINGGAQ